MREEGAGKDMWRGMEGGKEGRKAKGVKKRKMEALRIYNPSLPCYSTV